MSRDQSGLAITEHLLVSGRKTVAERERPRVYPGLASQTALAAGPRASPLPSLGVCVLTCKMGKYRSASVKMK